jgi:tRNA isopentenyl-2-thiomethyl-A-37 hydroxylase MiaE
LLSISAAEEIASLLAPSFKDRVLTHEGKAITDLLGFRTFREQRTAEQVWLLFPITARRLVEFKVSFALDEIQESNSHSVGLNCSKPFL